MSVKAICKITAITSFVMIGASEAEAIKDKFERCKPHCNVGTIGTVLLGNKPAGQINISGFGNFSVKHRKGGRRNNTDPAPTANIPYDLSPVEYRSRWSLPPH